MKRNYTEEDAAGWQITVSDFTDMTLKEAEKQLKALGLTAQTVGSGETVTAQIPAPGYIVPGNSQVLLYMGDIPEERTVAVPDFTGMTRQQASDAAGLLGLHILIAGNRDMQAVVTAQSQPKDTQVPVGTTITLQFADLKAPD